MLHVVKSAGLLLDTDFIELPLESPLLASESILGMFMYAV